MGSHRVGHDRSNLAAAWWLSGKEPACQDRRHRFDPWVRQIPWRGNGNHSSILAWEVQWTEGPGGLRKGHDLATKQHW